MQDKKAKHDIRELIAGCFFLLILFIVAVNIPEVKAYIDQLFKTVLSAVFIGVIVIIVGVCVWFFWFRE